MQQNQVNFNKTTTWIFKRKVTMDIKFWTPTHPKDMVQTKLEFDTEDQVLSIL